MARLITLFLILAVVIVSGCDDPNVMPIASAGPDLIVQTGSFITLDGSGSSDRYDEPLTYAWTVNLAPTGSTATLSNADSLSPTFTPDLDGKYIMELTVSDGRWSDTDTVMIIAMATAPPPDGDVAVLVLHTVDLIYGWQIGADPTDADNIIKVQYPSLVNDWDDGIVIATQITVPVVNAFSPELYEVVDWTISLKSP